MSTTSKNVLEVAAINGTKGLNGPLILSGGTPSVPGPIAWKYKTVAITGNSHTLSVDDIAPVIVVYSSDAQGGTTLITLNLPDHDQLKERLRLNQGECVKIKLIYNKYNAADTRTINISPGTEINYNVQNTGIASAKALQGGTAVEFGISRGWHMVPGSDALFIF